MNLNTVERSANTAIQHSPGGTVMTGDAIELFRYATLRSAIGLYKKTGMIPTRGVGIRQMLAQAAKITGKKGYTTGKGIDLALADLEKTIETLKAAIPHLNEKGEQI